MKRFFVKRPGCLVPAYDEKMFRRFEDKVSPEPMSGCWLWEGAINGRGYGHFRIDGYSHGAHRISYELFKSPIPADLHVLHKCDNPICVNPSHLFLGTPTDNARDMVRKGRDRPCVGESSGAAKLTEQDVQRILSDRIAKKTIRRIADDLGVSTTCVQNVCSGRTWRHVTGIYRP